MYMQSFILTKKYLQSPTSHFLAIFSCWFLIFKERSIKRLTKTVITFQSKRRRLKVKLPSPIVFAGPEHDALGSVRLAEDHTHY